MGSQVATAISVKVAEHVPCVEPEQLYRLARPPLERLDLPHLEARVLDDLAHRVKELVRRVLHERREYLKVCLLARGEHPQVMDPHQPGPLRQKLELRQSVAELLEE